METFILKIYRQNISASELVGTLQNINGKDSVSFTTPKALCALLASCSISDEISAQADKSQNDQQQEE